MTPSTSAPVAPVPAIQPATEPPPPELLPREWRLRLDPLLLLATLGLVGSSMLALSVSTTDDVAGDPHYYVIRQGVFAVFGLLAMYALSRVDYSLLRRLTYPIYGTMLVFILSVFPLGSVVNGSRSWIELPWISIQPSEFGKLMLIVALAGFVVERMRRFDRQTTAGVMLLGLLPVMLVMLQPDLGTAIVYVVVTVAVLFVAGAPFRHFAALGGLAGLAIVVTLVALPAVGVTVLKPYQVDRLTSFMDPGGDPSDAGYQQAQSKIAIGSGEKTGRGVDNATQTGLDFLPEHHTDFIFAVIGETYGFAGCALVLSLYALLVWRGLHILTTAKNLYGALIAGGITVMILFQVFVNVGMTIGIMPITGIPAPLLSYGGSSMLVTFMAVGLLQSIHAQARETAARKGRAPLFSD